MIFLRLRKFFKTYEVVKKNWHNFFCCKYVLQSWIGEITKKILRNKPS
jgi:hypothetical protein